MLLLRIQEGLLPPSSSPQPPGVFWAVQGQRQLPQLRILAAAGYKCPARLVDSIVLPKAACGAVRETILWGGKGHCRRFLSRFLLYWLKPSLWLEHWMGMHWEKSQSHVIFHLVTVCNQSCWKWLNLQREESGFVGPAQTGHLGTRRLPGIRAERSSVCSSLSEKNGPTRVLCGAGAPGWMQLTPKLSLAAVGTARAFGFLLTTCRLI